MILILTFIALWVGAKVPWKQIVVDVIKALTNSL
jgi:hypothetical protein